MPVSSRPLRQQAPHRLDVPLVAIVALATLGFGVTMPALVFDNLFGDESFSVLSGIWSFVTSGNLLLAFLLFGFSVAFPAVKLVSILVLWFAPVRPATRRYFVEWLELLAKWSLLDAFVITVIIGTVQLGWLSEAVAGPGAYVYLAAIVLSLIATFLLQPFVAEDLEGRVRPFRRRGLWLTVPAAVLYGAGLAMPLLEVEKAWFWGNRYSLLEGIGSLLAKGDVWLGGALLVFVVALPTLRMLTLLVLRMGRSDDARWHRWLLLLDRSSMVDVFAVALLIVFTKLDSLATPTPLLGMWLLVSAALLNAVDSFVLNRRARRDE